MKEEKIPKILRFYPIDECSLNPDFWRILAPDGSVLWNHYKRIPRKTIVEEYRLSSDSILEGVSDGRLEGLQVRLSPAEFRRVSNRIQDEKYRYWELA